MRLSWKIYAVIYGLLVIMNTFFCLLPESGIQSYYRVLIMLDRSRWVTLVSFYFAVMMEVLSLPSLFLFVFQKCWLSQNFWRLLFIGRMIGLLAGRNYEYNAVKSLLIANFWITLAAISVSALIALPSFAAQFIYAFKKNDYTD
ncbi:MAG: hypothetical protein Q8N14_01995 [Candidatus Omnitrophota bacterium]|nr:hypothetical protein [Candidatus Omnitrophota bacterium]